jgi:hypothetical protein
VGTGTNEDESSTGCNWAAEIQHVTARFRLMYILKLMIYLFIHFSHVWWGGGGHGKLQITEATDTVLL